MSLFHHILRQGDRVRMNMNREARSYGRKGVDDGTLGTVTGRFRATGIFENRYPAPYKRQPGVYSKDTSPMVIWDEYPDGVDPMDPEYARVDAGDLDAADTFYKEYRHRYATEWPVRNADGSFNLDFDTIAEGDKLDNLERTGDLPDTKFWELDIVSYEGRRHRIYRISYFGWGSQGVRGAGVHCYEMEGINEFGVYDGGGSRTVEPEELQLLERGNVWREAHGESLVFGSLDEEVGFACNMGRAPEVRNPANNLYSWTLDEVIQAIKDDIVDGFTNGTALFSDKSRISARRFQDRELGERVRAETVKGFDIEV
jgi:hypothetical protein